MAASCSGNAGTGIQRATSADKSQHRGDGGSVSRHLITRSGESSFCILLVDKEIPTKANQQPPNSTIKIQRGSLLQNCGSCQSGGPRIIYQDQRRSRRQSNPFLVKPLNDDVEFECSCEEIGGISSPDEVDLLRAIPNGALRLQSYREKDLMSYALSLENRAKVKVKYSSDGSSHFDVACAVVRYIGPLSDPDGGTYFGVELIDSKHRGQGMSDGEFGEKRYFTTKPNCALFVPVNNLIPKHTTHRNMPGNERTSHNQLPRGHGDRHKPRGDGSCQQACHGGQSTSPCAPVTGCHMVPAVGQMCGETDNLADVVFQEVTNTVYIDWRMMAHLLNLSNEDIENIDKRGFTEKERTTQMLKLWQKKETGCDKISQLSTACRKHDYIELANFVEQGLQDDLLKKIASSISQEQFRQFGASLKFSDEELGEMEQNFPNILQRVLAMLRKWRIRQSYNSDKIMLLSNALHSCGLRQLELEVARGLDDDIMRSFAIQIGNCWKVLAMKLDLDLKIIRDLEDFPQDQQPYQMLMLWRRRQHHSVDVLGALSGALRESGLPDLACELVQGVDDEMLDKLGQSVGDMWENLATHLGFSEEELAALKKDTCSLDTTTIINMLKKWRERHDYTHNRFDFLMRALRDCGLNSVADSFDERNLQTVKAAERNKVCDDGLPSDTVRGEDAKFSKLSLTSIRIEGGDTKISETSLTSDGSGGGENEPSELSSTSYGIGGEDAEFSQPSLTSDRNGEAEISETSLTSDGSGSGDTDEASELPSTLDGIESEDIESSEPTWNPAISFKSQEAGAVQPHAKTPYASAVPSGPSLQEISFDGHNNTAYIFHGHGNTINIGQTEDMCEEAEQIIEEEDQLNKDVIEAVTNVIHKKWKEIANVLYLERAIESIDKKQFTEKERTREMLEHWQTKQPGLDKISRLARACRNCGYDELAIELEQGLDEDMREKISGSISDTQWKQLGKLLKFKKAKLKKIELEFTSTPERVRMMLATWKTIQSYNTDKITLLSDALRKCGQKQLGLEVARGLDDEIVKSFAAKIGRRWRILADKLNLNEKVIHHLEDFSQDKQPYQMLILWRRRQPMEVDVLGALCKGLQDSGLPKLAFDLVQGVDDEMLCELELWIRDKWTQLALYLGFSEEEVITFKNDNSYEAINMLKKWRERHKSDDDRFIVLVHALRNCGLGKIAECLERKKFQTVPVRRAKSCGGGSKTMET